MSPRVWVPGVPAPQGSKRHVGRGVLVESAKAVGPWRERVALAVAEVLVWTEDDGAPRGAMLVNVRFIFTRPKAHFGTGKNAATVKPHAPRLPAGRPDLDKLARAVLDALTGIAYVDDAQVVALNVGKEYGNAAGADIVWRSLDFGDAQTVLVLEGSRVRRVPRARTVSRVPPMNGKTAGRRILAVPAGDVTVGDVLFNSHTMRELPVVAVRREPVRADGNLYGDPDDPEAPKVLAVVLTVLDPITRAMEDLGGFAERTRVQVVRHVVRVNNP